MKTNTKLLVEELTMEIQMQVQSDIIDMMNENNLDSVSNLSMLCSVMSNVILSMTRKDKDKSLDLLDQAFTQLKSKTISICEATNAN